jgi:murein L,D-transpeptidase YcbB/YkuD
MTITTTTRMGARTATLAGVALAAVMLAGCAGGASDADRAQARVSAKEKALTQAEEDFTAASQQFCESSKTYVLALDQYGDVLNDTATTVGDVQNAGADLVEPRDDALGSAQAAADAQQAVVDATNELAAARAAADPSAPAEEATPEATATPLAPAATVERVQQAEAEFEAAQGAITDETPLAAASESFNSAAVALEMSWLRLFVDAGCLPDEQQQQAEAAVRAYTTAIQQDLATVGFYEGAIDGVYGPQTVAAVEALQEQSGLPVTGAMDKATADALQARLVAVGGAAAQQNVATTAAIQQTLKLLGFWDGPVDGAWTPALTEAVMAFQSELGVEPTGAVDAATIAAFEKALSELKNPPAPSSPSPEPSDEPSASEEP